MSFSEHKPPTVTETMQQSNDDLIFHDELILIIGEFCAGAGDYRSLVNLALTCPAVHQYFKSSLMVEKMTRIFLKNMQGMDSLDLLDYD
ncbi:hypothetical protein QFC24_003004 [Naganishia onofrii]|uniref:Uncharacterized protein n=1 Tax=Naganishia onofrii TaxID=1851511 RepID=A0ACC2XPK8_9TREE|nr:hypothetical protein QFC24_003004 [Naganishia onofrii]